MTFAAAKLFAHDASILGKRNARRPDLPGENCRDRQLALRTGAFAETRKKEQSRYQSAGRTGAREMTRNDPPFAFSGRGRAQRRTADPSPAPQRAQRRRRLGTP